MSSSSVIDPEAIENLRSLNPGDNDEFLREITGIFLEDTPLRLAELDASLAAGDTGKFTRAAHSIKGSSANLGAVQLKAAAEKLEAHSRREGLIGVGDLIATVQREFELARTALQQLTGQT